MVVSTKVDRVVGRPERDDRGFLLVNHPLDCQVCDKGGGNCPLRGLHLRLEAKAAATLIEPKRHFVKPLALSPLIAIDREALAILCYRCVRFSREIAEDWQLIFSERGSHG